MSDPPNDETIQTFASVWDAIADTSAKAANLKLRAEFMGQIAAIVAEQVTYTGSRSPPVP